MNVPDVSKPELEQGAPPVLDLQPRLGPSLDPATGSAIGAESDTPGTASLARDLLAVVIAMAMLIGTWSLVFAEPPEGLLDNPMLQRLSTLLQGAVTESGHATDATPTEAADASDAPAQAAAEHEAESGAPAGDVSVNLVNAGNRPIIEVRIASSSDRAWGPDLLGENVVAEGASIRLKPDAAKGCRFDVLVRFDGGETDERHDLDFCVIAELTVPR